jgi:hypothetical protein
LKDATLYQIGLNNECFSTLSFFQNIIQAIANGLIVVAVCFYTGSNDLWMTGTLVYACIVMIANLRVLHVTNTHTAISLLLCLLSCISFFAWFWLESLFDLFPILYQEFNTFITSKVALSVIFFLSAFNYGQFIFQFNISQWIEHET